jgi:hypothetical protein
MCIKYTIAVLMNYSLSFFSLSLFLYLFFLLYFCHGFSPHFPAAAAGSVDFIVYLLGFGLLSFFF